MTLSAPKLNNFSLLQNFIAPPTVIGVDIFSEIFLKSLKIKFSHFCELNQLKIHLP